MLVVVDYGMGNLRSVAQAVMHAAQGEGVEVKVSSRPQDVRAAERIVLPGQGAMRDCMAELSASGLKDAVLEACASKPVMGVCVGMQMLLSHSEEQDTPGLGLIPGQVRRFRLEGQLQADGSRHKVPHMGWNEVHFTDHGQGIHRMFDGVPTGSRFYFVHSYFCEPAREEQGVAHTAYGVRFACAVARDNLFATQFHPEKSAQHGLQLYRNFLHWTP